MRLSSISFTHASTAMFGLAVVGYAGLRLAGYDVPHDPAHLALQAPSMIHRVTDTEQATDQAAQKSPAEEHLTPRAHREATEQAVVEETQQRVESTDDPAVAFETWSRDDQTWRGDSPTRQGPDPEPRHDATSDGPTRPSSPTDSTDSADSTTSNTADSTTSDRTSADTRVDTTDRTWAGTRYAEPDDD